MYGRFLDMFFFDHFHLCYAFWCAPVGFIFCTERLSVMLESSVARVDETHCYFVVISCVTLMTRYQMAMLTTQVLIIR